MDRPPGQKQLAVDRRRSLILSELFVKQSHARIGNLDDDRCAYSRETINFRVQHFIGF